MADVRCSFSCETRGYHECRRRWVSVLHEVLEVKHESRNCHDRYAIVVMKHLPGTLVASVVCHLPREISRCTYIHYYSLSKSVIQSNGCASQEITTSARFGNSMSSNSWDGDDWQKFTCNSRVQTPCIWAVSRASKRKVSRWYTTDVTGLQSLSDEELDYHSDSSMSESDPMYVKLWTVNFCQWIMFLMKLNMMSF